MDHMFVFRIRQECATLFAFAKFLWFETNAVQSCDATAHGEVPVRVEVVHHPVESLDVRELCGHMTQMSAKIPTAPASADIAENLARGHGQAGDQTTRAVANVFELAPLRTLGFHRSARIFSFKSLDA